MYTKYICHCTCTVFVFVKIVTAIKILDKNLINVLKELVEHFYKYGKDADFFFTKRYRLQNLINMIKLLIENNYKYFRYLF